MIIYSAQEAASLVVSVIVCCELVLWLRGRFFSQFELEDWFFIQLKLVQLHEL